MEQEPFGHYRWGCKWWNDESSIKIPQKIKTELPCNLAIPLLSLYPKEVKTWTQTGVCMPSVHAVFTGAKR